MAGDEDVRVRVTSDSEPSIFDGLAVGYRSGQLSRSTATDELIRAEAFAEINDEVFRIAGVRLPNPVLQDRSRIGGVRNETLGPDHPDNTERQWYEALSKLTSTTRLVRDGSQWKPADPRLMALLPRTTPEALNRRASEIRLEAAAEGADYNERFGLPGMLLSGIGDLAGGMQSLAPESYPQLAAGPVGAASRTVTGTAVRWGVAGMIGGAIGEVGTADQAAKMGQEYTLGDFATNVTLSGLVGGTLGVGGRVLGDAFTGQLGKARPDPTAFSPDVDAFRATPRYDAEREIIASVFGDQFARDTLDVLATRYEQQAAKDFLSGIERTIGQTAAREVAAGLRTMESNDAREALTEAGVPKIELDEEAYRALDEADARLRDLGEPPEPPAPARAVSEAERATVERIRDEAPTPDPGARTEATFRGVTRPITFEQFRPRDVGFDPDTFQYKRSSGPQGQTGALEGVQTFDPVSSGKVIVYERANGQRVVADGHQRLALAQRAEQAGQDVALDGYLYREADGWTPEEVRQVAAQKNLREGAGDPLDVASILREAPDLLDNTMPLNGAVMRTGRALARLTDEALGAVRNGLITPEQGAVIARVAADHPELHMPIVKQFMEDPPRSLAEAEFIAREMMALPTYREQASQMGLFGDAPIVSGARERGMILNEALKALREDRRAFAAAERFADDLEAAGNVLAREENARRADAAAALVKELTILATRAGPVADALRRITADAVENKVSARKAGQQFADEIVAMLNERGLLAMKTGAPSTPVPAPEYRPLHETLEAETRAGEIGEAHDLDDEAIRASMAEIAVERAMRGDEPPALDDDALGVTPEDDMALIDRALAAMEALGEDVDPTVREAAAAFLAEPDLAMYREARARQEPQAYSERADPEAPRTHTEAVEGDADVEAPFQPLAYKDEAKLLDDLKWVTLPELSAIAREFDVQATGSRAEITAAIMRDWRAAQPDPEPEVSNDAGVVVPGPELPQADVSDLLRRAAKFSGREDAAARYGDALADLVDAYARMPDAMKRLTREIEDTADERRATVLRAVRDELTNAPRMAEEERRYLGDIARHATDFSYAIDEMPGLIDRFDGIAAQTLKEIEALTQSHNDVPAGITEPIRVIVDQITAMKAPGLPVTRAQDAIGYIDKLLELDRGALPPELRAAVETYRAEQEQAIGIAQTTSVWDAIHGKVDDMDGSYDEIEQAWQAADIDALEAAHPELYSALLDVINETTDGFHLFSQETGIEQAQPHFAKIRRNLDELWDEWQATIGQRVAADDAKLDAIPWAERAKAEMTQDEIDRKRVDLALEDLAAAFDTAGEDSGPTTLRTFSRPKGVRMAEAPRGWGSIDSTVTRPPGMTPDAIVRTLEKRFGKKTLAALMERARLKIVARTRDLPIFRGADAKFAMAQADPAQIARRVKAKEIQVRMADKRWETVKRIGDAAHTSYAVPIGEKTMRVTLDQHSATEMVVAMNIDKRTVSGGGSMREAMQAFGTTIGVLRFDAQMRAKAGLAPVTYSFGGGDGNLHSFYARLLNMKGFVPDGYKAFLRLPDGMFHLIPDGVEPATFGKRMLPVNDDVAFARDFTQQGIRGVRGMAHDGVSYLVAENLQPENVNGILLHEVGVHTGMREMLGDSGFDQAISAMDALVRADDPEAIRARSHVPNDTPAHLIQEETLAYAITDYENLKVGGRLRTLIDRIVASARAWLWRTFPALRDKINLSIADLHALAEGGLRHVARKEGLSDAVGPRYAMLNDPRLSPGEGYAASRAIEGATPSQIAEEMQTSSRTVRSHLSQARRKAPDLHIPNAKSGAPAGMNTKTMQRGVTSAELLKMQRALMKSGMSKREANAAIAARTGLDPRQVTARQWKARQAEAPRFAMTDAETGALREGGADDLLRDARRLEEIADMLKDCNP